MRVLTERLELRPLPAAAAAALSGDREGAAGVLGSALSEEWPLPDLLDVAPRQVPGQEHFGIWTIVERASATVVGDVGFHGPPGEDGSVEIGYSIVPARRGRGYAAEAARALAGWALTQDGVKTVLARCEPSNAASIRTLERAGFRDAGDDGREMLWGYG